MPDRVLDVTMDESKVVKKETLYPVCPMLSRGAHQHRCIGEICAAFDNDKCSALQCKLKVTYI